MSIMTMHGTKLSKCRAIRYSQTGGTRPAVRQLAAAFQLTNMFAISCRVRCSCEGVACRASHSMLDRSAIRTSSPASASRSWPAYRPSSAGASMAARAPSRRGATSVASAPALWSSVYRSSAAHSATAQRAASISWSGSFVSGCVSMTSRPYDWWRSRSASPAKIPSSWIHATSRSSTASASASSSRTTPGPYRRGAATPPEGAPRGGAARAGAAAADAIRSAAVPSPVGPAASPSRLVTMVDLDGLQHAQRVRDQHRHPEVGADQVRDDRLLGDAHEPDVQAGLVLVGDPHLVQADHAPVVLAG